jgi:uncharacterized membrane protein
MAQTKTAGSGSRKRGGSTRKSQNAREPSPGDHAREAIAQWREAFRQAVGAVSSPRAGKRDGGRVGEAVDALLAKAGRPGKVASKMGLGSRAVARLRPSHDGAEASGNGRNGDSAEDHAPVPIQGSIEVAVPPKVAYALCHRFDEYPAFLEWVQDVEELEDGTLAFDVRLRGIRSRIVIAIVGERANRRIDWESVEGPEHVGMLSFHPLAPGLTHIELSVDLEPHGLVERFMHTVHLTEHAIRAELQRFKAYAELWQEDDETEDEESEEAEAEPATSA